MGKAADVKPTRASRPGVGGFTTGRFDALSDACYDPILSDYDPSDSLDIPMLVLEVGDVPQEPVI